MSMNMRIGIGYDAHKLTEGRKLILGGEIIPFEKGLLGHSDADVLTHAIIDALLGAAGLGDIGRHFPDSDERYKGISSLELLKNVGGKLAANGYAIINIDSVIIAQQPRLSAYINSMTVNLANCLCIPESSVNVKAKTEEGMGFTGDGSGIAAKAVCMLEGID